MEKHKLIDFDWLITNGMPAYDRSFSGRFKKGWKVLGTFPAKLVHPNASDYDMVTIFTKYTPYPKEENPFQDCSHDKAISTDIPGTDERITTCSDCGKEV